MCDTPENITFCTCSEKDENSIVIGTLEWTLDRFIGLKETNMRGILMRPADELGDSINIHKVIDEMNKRNCFDFDYVPQERDCFHISNGRKTPEYKYFSLIYKDGQWRPGRNPAFGRTISENIGKGKVTNSTK